MLIDKGALQQAQGVPLELVADRLGQIGVEETGRVSPLAQHGAHEVIVGLVQVVGHRTLPDGPKQGRGAAPGDVFLGSARPATNMCYKLAPGLFSL